MTRSQIMSTLITEEVAIIVEDTMDPTDTMEDALIEVDQLAMWDPITVKKRIRLMIPKTLASLLSKIIKVLSNWSKPTRRGLRSTKISQFLIQTNIFQKLKKHQRSLRLSITFTEKRRKNQSLRLNSLRLKNLLSKNSLSISPNLSQCINLNL